MSGERVAVADDDQSIAVTVYRQGQELSVAVTPLRALHVAQALIDAALPKLSAGNSAYYRERIHAQK